MSLQVAERGFDSSRLLDNIDRQDFRHAFDAIVADSKEFFASAFEKQPVHFKNSAPSGDDMQRRLTDLFSRKTLSEICQSNELDVETNIQAFRYNGSTRSTKNFKNETISVSELESSFRAGFSCQFFQPQRFSDGLHVLNAGFEYEFGTLTGASAYLTPARSQGLAPHHDDVEVFILQTEGSKLWRLWRGSIDLPETYSADIPRHELPDAGVEVMLRPGDVLYLPRGTIHEAVSQDVFSTHVTLSVYQHYNYKRLLSQVIENALDSACQRDIELRKGLPIRLSSVLGTFASALDSNASTLTQQRDEILSRVRSLAANVVSIIDMGMLDSAADDLTADFAENRLPPPKLPSSKEVKSSGKKRKKLPDVSTDTVINLYDPHCSHYTLREIEGVQMLALSHNQANNRLHHMGHPANDDDEEEDAGSAPAVHCIPSHYLPLIAALRESYETGGTSVRRLLTEAKGQRYDEEEVLGLLQDLLEQGFVHVVE